MIFKNIDRFYSIERVRAKEFFLNLLIVIFIILSLVLELKIDGGQFIHKPIIVFFGILIFFFVGNNILNQSILYIQKNTALVFVLLLFIIFNSLLIRHYFLFGQREYQPYLLTG